MSRDDDALMKRGGADSGLAGDGLSGLGGSLEREPDVIVLDIGSGSVKVGWAGEDAPRAVIPTLLLDHHGQAMPAAAMGLGGSGVGGSSASGVGGGIDQHHLERNEYAVGHAALQALHLSSTKLATSTANNLNLLHPVERGEIKVSARIQKACCASWRQAPLTFRCCSLSLSLSPASFSLGLRFDAKDPGSYFQNRIASKSKGSSDHAYRFPAVLA